MKPFENCYMQTLMWCVTSISSCTFQFTFIYSLLYNNILLTNFPRGQSHLSAPCFSSISLIFYSVLSILSFLPLVLCGSVFTLSLKPGESHWRLLGAHLLAIFGADWPSGSFRLFPLGCSIFCCVASPFFPSEHSLRYLKGWQNRTS